MIGTIIGAVALGAVVLGVLAVIAAYPIVLFYGVLCFIALIVVGVLVGFVSSELEKGREARRKSRAETWQMVRETVLRAARLLFP